MNELSGFVNVVAERHPSRRCRFRDRPDRAPKPVSAILAEPQVLGIVPPAAIALHS